MKYLLIILLLLIAVPSFSATENFTTGWAETDPNSNLSQTATRSTWTAITMGEDAWLARSSSVGLTGDFDISFDMYIDSDSAGVDDGYPNAFTLVSYDPEFAIIYLLAAGDLSNDFYLELGFYNDNTSYEDGDTDAGTLSFDTLYYCRFIRDDDGGISSNGLYTLSFYASSSNRASESSPSLALSFDADEKIDFSDSEVPSLGDDGFSDEFTGYIENLDFAYVPPVSRRIIMVQ